LSRSIIESPPFCSFTPGTFWGEAGREAFLVSQNMNRNHHNAVATLPLRKNKSSSSSPVVDNKRSSTHRLLLLSSILRIDVTDYDNPDVLQHRLRIYSTFILATSLFFWIWAMLNTIHLRRNNSNAGGGGGGMMMMDLGLISFFGTGVSASCLLRNSSRSVFSAAAAAAAVLHKYCSCCRRTTTNTGVISSDMVEHNNNKTTIPHHLHTPPGKCLRTFTLLTQLTVVANYMLGLLFAFTAGEHVYIYFASYCTIFVHLWLLASYVGWVIVTVYKEAVIHEYGEDDEVVETNQLRRNSSIGQQLRNLLIAWIMNNNNSNHHQSKTVRQQQHYNDKNKMNYDEEDDIDDELLAILKGQGGYST
jgi:hypothetical protein